MLAKLYRLFCIAFLIRTRYDNHIDKYNNNKYNNVKEFIDDVGRLGIFMEVL